MVLREFLKAESRILALGGRAPSNKLAGKGNVLQQSTVWALKKVAITREKPQQTGLFLQGNNLCGKLAKVASFQIHLYIQGLIGALEAGGEVWVFKLIFEILIEIGFFHRRKMAGQGSVGFSAHQLDLMDSPRRASVTSASVTRRWPVTHS